MTDFQMLSLVVSILGLILLALSVQVKRKK